MKLWVQSAAEGTEDGEVSRGECWGFWLGAQPELTAIVH